MAWEWEMSKKFLYYSIHFSGIFEKQLKCPTRDVCPTCDALNHSHWYSMAFWAKFLYFLKIIFSFNVNCVFLPNFKKVYYKIIYIGK